MERGPAKPTLLNSTLAGSGALALPKPHMRMKWNAAARSVYSAGLMFWLCRNKLAGSYFFFSSANLG